MGAIAPVPEVLEVQELTAFPEGVWRCPVELVLACSQSLWVDMIRKRQAAGDRYQPVATVFARGDRLFAQVFFYGAGNRALIFALDAWLDPVPQPFGRRAVK